jgi:4-amino-4-deoxy-L-arabinose transferase-like glycosyltransferase
MNATAWAFITPPFEATDEPSHFAYIKQLAETGTTPTTEAGKLSEEEEFTTEALESFEIRFNPDYKAVYSPAQQRRLERGLQQFERTLASKGSPDAGVANAEPPLYYALETIPYDLGSSGTLLARLQLARLLSALMAGFTVLFTFLFLHEALPRKPWAWTVGALAVALCPLFAFMSGAVNPDALLFAISAALFFCIARAFRRGLTMRSAITLGLVIAAGFATKLSFIGVAPGAFLAIGILAMMGLRRSGLKALRAPATAVAIGMAPVAAVAAHHLLANRTPLGIVDHTATAPGTLLSAVTYMWQLYLPRLPGMANDFPGMFAPVAVWFDGYVARLGWLDTFFPAWVYRLALGLAAVIAALCLRTLIARRVALARRAPELAVYAAMMLGMMVLIGVLNYRAFPSTTFEYGQTRYFLPLLPLLGAVVALAARGAGKRWGPAAGALIVVLFLAHDIFSQLQVIARFYA